MDAQQEDHPEAEQWARAAVEKYPDSPRAWYLLGESRHHSPHRTLSDRTEREEGFLRAVRLDPLYTPAYIHLLDIAFAHGDSAAVARTLPGYARGAGGSAHDHQYRLAQALAWGSAESRSAALAALDTIPLDVLERVPFLLGHPRFLALQEEVLAEIRRRPGEVSPARIGGLLAANALDRGKLRRLVGMVQDPGSGADPATFFFWLHTHVWIGLVDSVPADRRRIDRELTIPGSEQNISPARFLRVATYAIENDRWEEYSRTIRALRLAIEEPAPTDDARRTRDLSAALAALVAYEDVARGTGGLDRMEAAVRGSPPPVLQVRMLVLLLRAGRPEEALRDVEAYAPQPWLGGLAARLYEQVGDRDRAIEAWSWVRDGWSEADAELQPRVTEAKQEIERLRQLRT
jgi:hypothetical protein